MDFIYSIGNQIIENFDFVYILLVNVLTYLAIKGIDVVNKEKEVSTWQKRIVLLLVIAVLTGVYIGTGYEKTIVLINSAIVSPVS